MRKGPNCYYNKVGLIIRFIRLIIKRKFKPCWSIIIISGFVMLDLWFFVYCVVDLCMSLCPYYFGHCVVCHSSMYHLGIFKLFFEYKDWLIIRFIRLIIKRKFKPCWSIIITCAASKLVMKCTLCHLHVLLLTGFLTL
jgi:hypothetical protein